MRNYIIRRLIQMVPVFLGILLLLFFILEQAPGGPTSTMINPHMSVEQKAEIAAKYGVGTPWYEQFGNWIVDALHGNFGYSITHKKPVIDVIGDYIGPTLALSSLSLLLAILVGIPFGIISAVRQYSKTDNLLTVVSLIGISLPSFFFGLLLIRFLSVDLGWFPIMGLQDPLFKSNLFGKIGDYFWHLILPCMVLGLGSAASFMRYTRSSMLEVIRQDYIRTARAKGLRERVVIYKHAFRNAMIPIITLLGFWIPGLLSGAVMTETVFALPGLGKISYDASMNRNYPLILGINAMLAFLTLIGTLVADILYAAADPRIKYD